MSDEIEVEGVCPACGWHSLFLGIGGLVLCNRAGECPAPDAAADLLSLKPSAIRLAAAAVPLHIVTPDADPERLRASIMSGWHEPPIIVPAPQPPVLSPEQLHEVAERLRLRYLPPSTAMRPDLYLVSEGMHALADALDDVARQR